MISKEQKLTYLDKILNSTSFSNSPSSSALLRFLAEKSIQEEQLKEGIIEMELYGEDTESEKSNPRVRVNVYNLRRRLASYYEKEGKDDKVRFEIDKGQYNIRFESKGKTGSAITSLKYNRYIPYFIIAILVVVIVIQNIPASKPAVWKRFINNDLPINLIVSDAFGVISTVHTGKPGWVCDYRTHNLKDYYELIQNNPNLKDSIIPATYTYVNEESAVAACKFKELLSPFGKDFEIKLSSKTQFADIVSGNMIYIGNPLKINITTAFNDANPYCNLRNGNLVIRNHPTQKDTSIYIHMDVHLDYEYAIVGRFKGPQNTEQFYFFSLHEIGNMAMLSYFTNRNSLKDFKREKLKDHENFIALYKVYGKERINTRFEEILILSY